MKVIKFNFYALTDIVQFYIKSQTPTYYLEIAKS